MDYRLFWKPKTIILWVVGILLSAAVLTFIFVLIRSHVSAATDSPKKTLTLKEAMNSVSEAIAASSSLAQSTGNYNAGLMPSQVTVTLNISSGETTDDQLIVESGDDEKKKRDSSPLSVSTKGSTQTQHNNGNQITIVYSSLYFRSESTDADSKEADSKPSLGQDAAPHSSSGLNDPTAVAGIEVLIRKDQDSAALFASLTAKVESLESALKADQAKLQTEMADLAVREVTIKERDAQIQSDLAEIQKLNDKIKSLSSSPAGGAPTNPPPAPPAVTPAMPQTNLP